MNGCLGGEVEERLEEPRRCLSGVGGEAPGVVLRTEAGAEERDALGGWSGVAGAREVTQEGSISSSSSFGTFFPFLTIGAIRGAVPCAENGV
mmetsp:Transcript_8717/g.21378  ORF Transcript_8717/g.21378 Transcript_8717/m.21378 type:complete len:92 (+) Transcript_8717:140-415(+)